MRRASVALALCSALLILGSLASCSDDADLPDPRPDIVLIVIDTLRADHVGIYGHERPTTPSLDALAAEGTWFRRAYAHSSWTLPSITSLLTGLLPHEHAVGRDPLLADHFGRLSRETPTLAELLSSSGYSCGAVINNTFMAPEFGLHRGFGDDYDYVGANIHEIRSAEVSVDAALAWIARQSAPYFLLLHLMEPHMTYDPPKAVRGTFTGAGTPPVPVPFASRKVVAPLRSPQNSLTAEQLDYVEKLYDEEILAVDRALGRMFAALRQRERWPDTALIVTSDHGEEFDDHGGIEHGHTLYGELTRVPLIARGPGIEPGEISTPVEHVDLFQGILSLARVTAPPDRRGRDVFALPSSRRFRHVSENTLYGHPRASIIEDGLRLQIDLQSRHAEVWRLDGDGLETEPLPASEIEPVARRMSRSLARIRGNLEPTSVAGPHVPDREAFERLRALGYIGEP